MGSRTRYIDTYIHTYSPLSRPDRCPQRTAQHARRRDSSSPRARARPPRGWRRGASGDSVLAWREGERVATCRRWARSAALRGRDGPDRTRQGGHRRRGRPRRRAGSGAPCNHTKRTGLDARDRQQTPRALPLRASAQNACGLKKAGRRSAQIRLGDKRTMIQQHWWRLIHAKERTFIIHMRQMREHVRWLFIHRPEPLGRLGSANDMSGAPAGVLCYAKVIGSTRGVAASPVWIGCPGGSATW